MKVTIIRHGRTQSNTEQKYSRLAYDEPLTESGRAELRPIFSDPSAVGASGSVPAFPENALLVVSSMARAKETAEILFPGIHQNIEGDLREMEFGKFEGKHYTELDGDPDYQLWIDSGGTMAIPGGESMASFTSRVMNGFRNAVRAAAGFDELYIVAHGGTIMAVMSTLTGGNYYDFHSANGCGYTIDLEVDDAGNIVAAGAYDSFCGGIHTGSAGR